MIIGIHIFVGNFTYVIDFMIVEDISSIIDPRLSQVVLGKPFVEISNMTYDPPERVVRFTNGTDEIAYKIPHKIEQYNLLSDLEREHIKSVYLRNKEDKRRGFYKECLELGPEYLTGIVDEELIAGTLTDEAIRNGSIKKNPEKRGNGGEPSKDRNERDDNKRSRTGNAFATTTNPVRRENTEWEG
ncbi:hypothetical protein Tco_0231978 [Tanacetum coccineum]